MEVGLQTAQLRKAPQRTYREPVVPTRQAQRETTTQVSRTTKPTKQDSAYNVVKAGVRSVFDAGMRTFIRQAEDPHNNIQGALVRGALEPVRKNAEGLLVNALNGRFDLTRNEMKLNTLRGLEHVPSRLFIKPSLAYSNPAMRVLAGLADVLGRKATSYGSYKAGAMEWKDFGHKNLTKDIGTRSLGRLISINGNTPISNFVQQLGMNAVLHCAEPAIEVMNQ